MMEQKYLKKPKNRPRMLSQKPRVEKWSLERTDEEGDTNKKQKKKNTVDDGALRMSLKCHVCRR